MLAPPRHEHPTRRVLIVSALHAHARPHPTPPQLRLKRLHPLARRRVERAEPSVGRLVEGDEVDEEPSARAPAALPLLLLLGLALRRAASSPLCPGLALALPLCVGLCSPLRFAAAAAEEDARRRALLARRPSLLLLLPLVPALILLPLSSSSFPTLLLLPSPRVFCPPLRDRVQRQQELG
eukprot:1341021-Rhodomonas_salina.1